MSTEATILLALAAGFLGGFVSQRFPLAPVYAQAQPGIPQTAVPKEIRAQNFVIVDENGAPQGAFGFDKRGNPGIEVIAKGHHYWVRWLGGLGKGATLVPRQ